MPTREQVIDVYKYQFGGLVMDALRNRDGRTAAMAVDLVFATIERLIGEIYDVGQPPPPLPVKPVQPAGPSPASKPAAGPTGRPQPPR